MLLPQTLTRGAQALLDSDTSIGKALRYGVDQPTENFATTLQAMGFKDAEKFMRELIDAPENYESAAGKFINEQNKENWGDYEWQYFPRFVLEQAGQLAGSLLTRAGGVAAGTAIAGPPGALALGVLGPFLFEAVQVAGPIAMDHAKRRSPVGVEKEPTWEDWKYALPGTAFSGVLNSIGVFNIGKLNSTILGSGFREGVTETGQGLIEQIFGSLGTPGGVEIDTHAAVAEGLAGAGTGVAAQTPVSVARMLETPTPTEAVTEMAETVSPPLIAETVTEEPPTPTEAEEVSPPLIAETVTEEPPTPTEAEELPAVSPGEFRPAFTDEEIAAGDVQLITQIPEEITTETFFSLPADIRQKYTGKRPLFSMEENIPPQLEFKRRLDVWTNYLLGAGKTPLSRQEMGQLLGRKIEDDFVFTKSDFNERVDEYVKEGYIESYEHESDFIKFKKTDDDYEKLPDTEYTRSPQFKQDLAEYIIKQKLGLTQKFGYSYQRQDSIQRPTATKKKSKTEKKGRYDSTIVQAAKDLLFDKAADNFYRPVILDTIEMIEDSAREGDPSNQFVTKYLENLTPQGRNKIMDELLLPKIYEQSVPESDDSNYLTSWPDIFKKLGSSEDAIMNNLISTPFADINFDSAMYDNLREKTQELIVDSLIKLETTTFKQGLEKEGFFENFEAQEPTLFANLTDREKARLKTSFIKEVGDHPDVYRSHGEQASQDEVGGLLYEEATDKIKDLIRNLNIAKEAGRLSKGLPQDVVNRFIGHDRLNRLSDVVRGTLTDDIDVVSDAVGPLTPKVFTVAELAQGKSGPIDPNFLSYSVLRKQLDKLQGEGLASLPANEILSYITEPYSKLSSELKKKEGVPQFSDPTPQTMAGTGGYKRPGPQTRRQEAQDMQILPFLEALGEQDVDIAYLKDLITHHVSGFDIHVGRDWVPGESVYTYEVIKGPHLGRFDIITQHLPLLSPSEQALVDRQRTEGDLTPEETERLKNIFLTSPDVYTERDMHNWIKHPVSGIKGMGTVMWVRGTRRKALPKKDSRFGNQEVIGWMPDESQSYWIQKTRRAISIGKQTGRAATRTFRYDYAKEREKQLETNKEQQLDLDELITDEATLREPAREELKNYLINTPVDKTEQFPEGYWKSYLTRSDVGDKALDNLFSDINRLYRGRTRTGEYLTNVPVAKWGNRGAHTFFRRDPAYEEKFKSFREREDELEDTFYEELLIEEQPFVLLGKRIDDQTLAEIKEVQVYQYSTASFVEKVKKWIELQGWDMHTTDPERADEKVLKEDINAIRTKAGKQARRVLDEELVEAQIKAVEKITKHLPDFSEYIKTIARMPSEEQVQAYEESLREGERKLLPDPPFRESFNRMNLRHIVVQSLKNGEKFIIIPGSRTGTGKKMEYDLEVQTKYGQKKAPEGNYKQMLNEGHELAEEFGLRLEVMDLDVGGGKKADVTVINIEPLYNENLIPEEGLEGYKHGGLVTKAQGAGYNINYGDYGRSYN